MQNNTNQKLAAISCYPKIKDGNNNKFSHYNIQNASKLKHLNMIKRGGIGKT